MQEGGVPSGPEPIGDVASLSISGYGDIRFLARGGSSVVYRATRVGDGREVAIKVLDGSSARHARELDAFERLVDRPNILVMVDHGTLEDGRTWIATEYAELGSTDGLMRAGPLPPETVARFGAQAASALAAAHEAGIVHADVKPSNLLLNADGGVVLGDFGIAQTDPTATGPATMSMTLLYSAPEVLLGETPTAASDIYSLGLTLYALATGRHPYNATSQHGVAQLVDQITTGPAPVPPDTTPVWLSAIIGHCTSKDPTQRYARASEVAHDLTYRHATPPTGRRPRRSRLVAAGPGPRRLAVGAVAAVLVVAVGALSWTSFGTGSTTTTSPTTTTTAPPTGCVPTVVEVRVGQRPYGVLFDGENIWVANRTSNTVSRIDPESNNVINTIDVTDHPRYLAFDGTDIWVSNNESDTVARIDRRANVVTAEVPVGENPAGVVYDGSAIWVANQMSGTVSRIDPGTLTVTDTVAVGGQPYSVTFDGSAVWVTNEMSHAVSRIDIETREETEVDVGGPSNGIAFDADGSLLWITQNGANRVITVAPDTGEIVDEVELGAGPFGIVFVGPNAWVSRDQAGLLTAIDTETVTVTDNDVDVGPNPWAMATDGTDIWVPAGGSNDVFRVSPC